MYTYIAVCARVYIQCAARIRDSLCAPSLRGPCLHKTVHVSGLGTGWKYIYRKKKQSRLSSSSAAFYSQTLKPSKAINYSNRLRVTAKIYLLSALVFSLHIIITVFFFFYYFNDILTRCCLYTHAAAANYDIFPGPRYIRIVVIRVERTAVGGGGA